MVGNLGLPQTFDEALAAAGERARALRLLRNLSQEELAVRAGVGAMTVRRFEKTGHLSLESALRIAFALGVEDGFQRLFEAPRYATLDEALAQPTAKPRQRVRRRR